MEHRCHELKTWSEYYQEVEKGTKTFEIRKNDRDFTVGDILILKEYDPVRETYTGKSINMEVTYILDKQPYISEGYVCMGMRVYMPFW